ncbi:hypothetical protein AMECASPLE_032441 [Ameca splendens]|uniref:Uncharacterized protein n=1 Tax=Ameca splendens TaxID=208324 RepID=A0ABV0XVH9_9TELE
MNYCLCTRYSNCVPENSLQKRCLYETEWSGFPSLEGGQPRPHHRGYSNCAVGWRTERTVFHPQLRRLAKANRLFTVDVSSNLVAPYNVSSPRFMRLGFGQRDRSDLE